MTSIIVATPKRAMADAAQEAEDAKKYGGDTKYFRRFSPDYYPASLRVGDKVFYVEDGYIRGYGIVSDIVNLPDGQKCDTTGKGYEPGVYVFMRADSWKWINPSRLVGFQGFRYVPYLSGDNPLWMDPVGGWLDPKPEVIK